MKTFSLNVFYNFISLHQLIMNLHNQINPLMFFLGNKLEAEDESEDEDDEQDPFSNLRNNPEPHPLAPGLNISLQNSILLHLTFAERHNLTKAALKDLLKLTSLHLMKPNNFPLTLSNMYSSNYLSEVGVTKKYFCKNCFGLLNKDDTKCAKCDFAGKDFFIFNNIEEQLRKQFQSML